MVPSLEVPGNQMGPRGTAPNDKSLKSFISGAAPWNPMAPPLETPVPPLETPWRRASKPQVRRASKPLGTKFETKIFKFRWFLGPSDQNELYHTPLLSKIWDLGDRKFFGGHLGREYVSREKKLTMVNFLIFVQKNVSTIRFQEIKIRPFGDFEKMRFLCFYIIGV